MEERGGGEDGQEYKERDKFLKETSTRRGKGEILQCTHVIIWLSRTHVTQFIDKRSFRTRYGLFNFQKEIFLICSYMISYLVIIKSMTHLPWASSKNCSALFGFAFEGRFSFCPMTTWHRHPQALWSTFSGPTVMSSLFFLSWCQCRRYSVTVRRYAN